MAADAAVNFNLLHRTCKLVVLLCFLHISVTIVFYIRSLDIRFAFVQNQQSYQHSTQSSQPRHPSAASHVESQETQKVWTPKSPEEKETPKKLEKCPETSPLLGKSSTPAWLDSRAPVEGDLAGAPTPETGWWSRGRLSCPPPLAVTERSVHLPR